MAAALPVAALLAGCANLSRKPTGVALVGVTVIDGSGAPPQRDMVVVVREGHIEAVRPVIGFRAPPRTEEVDLAGRTVIPGLIDAHAHVERWALPRYLAWGVTAVRDVHGTLDSILALRERAKRGALAGPRIYSAGAMLDGEPTTYPDALGVSDETGARKAVDRLAVAGVDYLKAYTRMTPALLGAMLDEAKTFKLRVTAHLGLTDAVTAARLGLASEEHLSGIPEAALADPAPLYAAHRASFFAGWTAFERSWAGLDSTALERVARELAATGVTLVPTLVLHETFSRLDAPAAQQDSALAAVPPAQIERWNTPDMIRRAGWTAADFAAFRRARPNQDFFVRRFSAAGGTVAAGTDASNQQLVPGASVHTELELLTRAGLTPLAAIAAATGNAARLLGADSLGVLAPGKVADLVVLRGDPSHDIRRTRAIEQVMLRGRFLRADSLRQVVTAGR
ncbi:MAG TPA: amidohydrolase family protein [Gemmatimonadales bacterium]|nr:amidohydrolase family protein [Gemmatimonadales bacterium]